MLSRIWGHIYFLFTWHLGYHFMWYQGFQCFMRNSVLINVWLFIYLCGNTLYLGLFWYKYFEAFWYNIISSEYIRKKSLNLPHEQILQLSFITQWKCGIMQLINTVNVCCTAGQVVPHIKAHVSFTVLR